MVNEAVEFSGAYCAGLIEAARSCFLRSLRSAFSGAYCAGLIEAYMASLSGMPHMLSFPALIAPASLKRHESAIGSLVHVRVFRRLLRRPH